MKAINLMPGEQKRGAGGGRSGGAAYALLGVLAGLVALGGLYGMARHQVSDRKAKAAVLSVQAKQAQSQAAALTSYTGFVAMRDARVQAVEQLAASRFDWAHAFHEIGRVLPFDVALTQLTGSVGGTPGSAAAATAPTAGGGAPTIEITGCAVSQPVVAETIERLQGIDGVSAVSLESTDKTQAVGSSGVAAAGGATDCRQGHPGYPLFKLNVAFVAVPSGTAAAGTGAASASAAGSAPATPAAATPAAAAPAASTPATPASSTPAAAPAASKPTSTTSAPAAKPAASTKATHTASAPASHSSATAR
jgi:Tfp pilus assembly protein PilN